MITNACKRKGPKYLEINRVDEDDSMVRTNRSRFTFSSLLTIGIVLIIIGASASAMIQVHFTHDSSAIQVPDYSILPKRIYSVIGLEDSGTRFISDIIGNALNIGKDVKGAKKEKHFYRNGSNPYLYDKLLDVQVQHFSLPFGSSCTKFPIVPIVDVVLPSQCMRDHPRRNNEMVECNSMTRELYDLPYGTQKFKYPIRYNLDIVSHKEWYDSHNVDQWFIIVIRDPDVSRKARSKKHCADHTLLKEEEKVGTSIIVKAINKYILEEGERKLTSETYNHWHASNFQNDNERHGRRLSPLPSGNNVVLVSYESMMKLGEIYIALLYTALGIRSDFVPDIKNGNKKYLNNVRSSHPLL